VYADLIEALRQDIAGNTVGQILAAALVVIVFVLFRNTVVAFLFARLKQITDRTNNPYDGRLLEAVRGPFKNFIVLLGFFIAITILTVEPELAALFAKVFQGGSIAILLWAVLMSADVFTDILGDMARKRNMELEPFMPLIKRSVRIFIVVGGVILVIQNLGYSVGSLLAGLGIGGLAVALAAQDSLSNLFGSVTIAADLPLKIGDHVKLGNFEGIVEEVGMRSTRIRTFENTIVQIPNRTIASDPVENVSRRARRRVRHLLGVTYSTTPEQMQSILRDIRAHLASRTDIFDDAQFVHFMEFGASSLDIQIVYFTKELGLAGHLATREDINLELMRIVKRNGSSIAFPTRTLHVEGGLLLQRAPLPKS
jgi:MscS family membrane protein